MSVSDIQDTARTNGQAVKGAAATAAAEGAEAVRGKAERAKQALQDTARKGAEAARTQAAAAGRKLTQVTQDQPMASLGTTLAVGLLAGFVIGLFVGQATAD